jgi:hypothetical protein
LRAFIYEFVVGSEESWNGFSVAKRFRATEFQKQNGNSGAFQMFGQRREPNIACLGEHSVSLPAKVPKTRARKPHGKQCFDVSRELGRGNIRAAHETDNIVRAQNNAARCVGSSGRAQQDKRQNYTEPSFEEHLDEITHAGQT